MKCDLSSVAEHDLVEDQHVPPGRDGGGGEVDGDDVVVADQILGRPQRLLGFDHVGLMAAAELAGRHLGGALLRSGEDLRHLVGLAAGVALPPVEPYPGLGELAPLPVQVLLGRANRPCGRVLLDRERSDEAAQVATVDAGRPGPELDDLVDQVEQLPVVADHDDRAGPPPDRRGYQGPSPAVEVVGRFVENQGVRSSEEQTGQGGQHHLPPGQLPEPGVEVEAGQTQLGQRRRDPFGQVPVAVEPVQVLRAPLSALGPPQCGQPLGHTEQLGDRPVDVERQLLRQVADHVGPYDVAGRGPELADEDAQQGGLALAVAPDQAGEPIREDEVEVGEHGVAVGPGEAQPRTDEGWHGALLRWPTGAATGRRRGKASQRLIGPPSGLGDTAGSTVAGGRRSEQRLNAATRRHLRSAALPAVAPAIGISSW